MATTTQVELRREPWRYVARAAASLAALCAIAYWLFTAAWIEAFRCDENCGVGDYDRWQYTGQAVLAVAGAVLAVCALALGFTTRQRAYHVLLGVSVATAVCWYLWLVEGGF